MTPSGKLVRRVICDTYKRKIDALFLPEAGDDVIDVTETAAPHAAIAGAFAHAS